LLTAGADYAVEKASINPALAPAAPPPPRALGDLR